MNNRNERISTNDLIAKHPWVSPTGDMDLDSKVKEAEALCFAYSLPYP